MMSIDEHLAKPWRTRRLAFLLSVFVSLGLCVYATIQGVPIQGETILIALLTSGGVSYTAGRVYESVKQSKGGSSPNTPSDDI